MTKAVNFTFKNVYIYIYIYIDKLDNIVNKCNNTYHSTIKMKSVYENQAHILILLKKVMK